MAKKNKQRNRPQDDQQDPNAVGTQDDTVEDTEEGEEEEVQPQQAAPQTEVKKEEHQPTPEERARATYDLPSDWTDAAINKWIDNADHVTIRTERGNFVYDPTRTERDVTRWSMGEVSDWIEGKLSVDLPDASADLLVQRYADRNGSERTKGWGRVEWVNFVDTGVEPIRDESGYLVDSSLRDRSDVSTLDKEELEALLRGSIVITPSKHNDVVAVAKKVLHLPSSVTTFEEAQKAFANHQVESNDQPTLPGLTKVDQENIEHALNEYYEAVKPGKEVTDQAGLQAQIRLDALFAYCRTIEGQGFVSAMNTVADFVGKHRDGLFSDTYAFRFIHLLNGTAVNVRAHVATITGLTIISGSNPGKIKQHDLRYLFSGLSEENAGRMTDYFKVRGAELASQRRS